MSVFYQRSAGMLWCSNETRELLHNLLPALRTLGKGMRQEATCNNESNPPFFHRVERSRFLWRSERGTYGVNTQEKMRQWPNICVVLCVVWCVLCGVWCVVLCVVCCVLWCCGVVFARPNLHAQFLLPTCLSPSPGNRGLLGVARKRPPVACSSENKTKRPLSSLPNENDSSLGRSRGSSDATPRARVRLSEAGRTLGTIEALNRQMRAILW